MAKFEQEFSTSKGSGRVGEERGRRKTKNSPSLIAAAVFARAPHRKWPTRP